MTTKTASETLRIEAFLEVDGIRDGHVAFSFVDVRGRKRRLALSASKQRSPREVLVELDRCGAKLPSGEGALNIVKEVLAKRANKTCSATRRTGWFENEFVLPSKTFSRNVPPKVRHLDYFSGLDNESSAGSLQEWQRAAQKIFNRSDTAIAVVGVALAGSLLNFFPALTGIAINLAGESGAGKTSMLKLANSVWSKAESIDLPKLNVTAARLEAVCFSACDRFVAFDEFGASDLTNAGRNSILSAFAFLVSGGAGKARSESGSAAVGHGNLTFRVSAMTTSEEALADMAAGSRVGGAELRFIDIATSPREKGGVLNSLSGKPVSEDALRHELSALMISLSQNWGVLGPAYAKAITRYPGIRKKVQQYVNEFTKLAQPNKSTQIQSRYVDTFGLIYAALRMARKFGLLSLSKSTIETAVLSFFDQSEQVRRNGNTVEDGLRRLGAILQDPATTPEEKRKHSEEDLAFIRTRGGRREACVDPKKFEIMFGKHKSVAIEKILLSLKIQLPAANLKSRQQVTVCIKGYKKRERRMIIDLEKLNNYLNYPASNGR